MMPHVENYKEEHFGKLKEYYLKHWNRKEEYFHYLFKEFPSKKDELANNLVAFDDENNVVGCHLVFPTKAKIEGVEKSILWGHDTFIEDDYRGDLGLDLMIKTDRNYLCFGAGLSEINYKIQKRLKSKFLGQIHGYVFYNWKTPYSIIRSLFVSTNDTSISDTIRIDSFDQIKSISELKIPNRGYWFGNTMKIDFIRDEHFIEKRFLKNFAKYYLFAHKNCDGFHDMYFVVRFFKTGKGFPSLSIVDFRFNNENKSSLYTIIKTVKKLASENNIPFVGLYTNLLLKKSIFHRKLTDDKLYCVVGPKCLSAYETEDFVYTTADSDMDFLGLIDNDENYHQTNINNINN